MTLQKFDQFNKRKMISIAIIFFLMFSSHLFTGPVQKVALTLFILISYVVMLLVPKLSWTPHRLLIAFILITAENAAALYWFHEKVLIYFFAIVILLTTVRLKLDRKSILVIAAMYVAAILYIWYSSRDVSGLLSFIILPIALYLTVRNRIQRNEMYELNKLQLVELQEAYDQLQEASITAMQYAVLEERTRIAREIHDAVGHSLTSLIVQMQALKYMVKKDPEKTEESLEGMLVVARQGLHDIRHSVHSLADDRKGSGMIPLKALLSRMEAMTSIQYEFHSNMDDEETNTEVNGLLYRVLQEAITNIIRHSEATKVEVSLNKEAGRMVLHIRDNGIVESHQQVEEGFGLKVMRARLKEHGGQLRYSILEPNGFGIKAEIPVDFGE